MARTRCPKQRIRKLWIMLLAAAAFTAGCAPGDTESGKVLPQFADGPYDLNSPDTSFSLPEDLLEISGLTPLDDGRLAAVQDERGIVFVIDGATGTVTSKVHFGKRGDYEGIERVNAGIFVLRSNGNLTELADWMDGRPDVRSHETDLSVKNDTEGLAYDALGRRLLLVTKELPGPGLDARRHKAVYAWDLESHLLDRAPAITVDVDSIRDALPGLRRFKPSGLAVHPASGDIYIVSANEHALVALDPSGDIRHAWRLNRRELEKPEGIAFSADGSLFIASEGVRRPPMLFRFDAGDT